MAKRGTAALDRRISILRATAITSDFNEPAETWSVYVSIAAGVTDVTAGERYRAQEVGADIGTRFLVRWSPDVASVDPRDRVLYDGREYNITAVRDIERQMWREIDAVRRADIDVV